VRLCWVLLADLECVGVVGHSRLSEVVSLRSVLLGCLAAVVSLGFVDVESLGCVGISGFS
jgi:hypothetical protein